MGFSFDTSTKTMQSSSSTAPQLDPNNFQSPFVDIAPPTAPNTSELSQQYAAAPALARRNTKPIDDLITATRVAAGQSADNAAAGYSARLQQMGINPVSAGVVRAQTQSSAEAPINDLTVQKEQMQYDARKDSASLAAQIANQLGAIRESYSRTLADYNEKRAAQQQQNNQFNASTALDVGKTNAQSATSSESIAAQLAIAGVSPTGSVLPGRTVGGTTGAPAGGASDFYPGYITNDGPIISGRKNGTTYPGFIFENATNKYI